MLKLKLTFVGRSVSPYFFLALKMRSFPGWSISPQNVFSFQFTEAGETRSRTFINPIRSYRDKPCAHCIL
jgi:hypothetical protein